MTSKKISCLALFLVLAASLAFSADPPDAQKQSSAVAFNVGDFYLSPQVLGTSTGGKIALGANAEYFLSKTIAIGGDAAFYVESPGGLTIFPDVEYHFSVQVRSLDVYVGAGPSLYFRFGTNSKTLFGGKGFAAARYFFTPGTGVFLKLGVATNENGATGYGAIGISFKI